MLLYPLDECLHGANDCIDNGGTVYQQFLCGKCGMKQTIDIPNTFYVKGACEECKHVTDLAKTGCNYMVTYSVLHYG